MAYFQKKNEDDQNNNGNQNQMTGGNIYSTSGSEVSSTLENNSPKGNSTSSASNESGNWVNLNKYLDANQGKVGNYVDSLANPYTSKVNDYQSSIEANRNKYIQDVNNQDSVNFNKDQSSGVVSNYMKNSGSVDDSKWGLLQNTLKGYAGPDQYSLTGDQYNYNQDRKQADEFGNFGSNFNNQDYRMSLMDSNLSSGGKKLNNFLLGTSDAQSKINDYSQQFKDLSALLDQNEADMNDVYNSAVGTANQNKQDIEKAVADAQAQQRKAIEQRYAQEQAKAQALKNDRNQYIEYYNYPYTNAKGETFYIRIPVRKTWNPTETNAATNRENELNEVDRRAQDLLTGNRSGATTFDLDNMSFGNYQSQNETAKRQAGKKVQDALNLNNQERQLKGYSDSGILDALFAPATTNADSLLNIFNPNNNLSTDYNAAVGQDLLDAYITGKISERDFFDSLLTLVMLREVPDSQEIRKAYQELQNELRKL